MAILAFKSAKINMVGLAMLIAACGSYVLLVLTLPPAGTVADGSNVSARITAVASIFIMLIAGHAQAIVLALTAKSVRIKRYASYGLIAGIGMSVMFFAYLVILPIIGFAVGWALFALFALTGTVHTFFNVEQAPKLTRLRALLLRLKKTPA